MATHTPSEWWWRESRWLTHHPSDDGVRRGDSHTIRVILAWIVMTHTIRVRMAWIVMTRRQEMSNLKVKETWFAIRHLCKCRENYKLSNLHVGWVMLMWFYWEIFGAYRNLAGLVSNYYFTYVEVHYTNCCGSGKLPRLSLLWVAGGPFDAAA